MIPSLPLLQLFAAFTLTFRGMIAVEIESTRMSPSTSAFVLARRQPRRGCGWRVRLKCGLALIIFGFWNIYVALQNQNPPPFSSTPTQLSPASRTAASLHSPQSLFESFVLDAALFPAVTMDGDPAVEPELDSFSLTLPLPYRVALIVVLGTLLLL